MKTPNGNEYGKTKEIFHLSYKEIVRKGNDYIERLQQLSDEKELTCNYYNDIEFNETIIRIDCCYNKGKQIVHIAIPDEWKLDQDRKERTGWKKLSSEEKAEIIFLEKYSILMADIDSRYKKLNPQN